MKKRRPSASAYATVCALLLRCTIFPAVALAPAGDSFRLMSCAKPLVQLHHRRSSQRNLSVQLLAFKRQPGGVELGIQTAQLLMDPRRHDKLKHNIQQRFPFVPEEFLDGCIDLTAEAFTSVAPNKLKLALKPGGMEKVRPDIERSIVEIAMKQPLVRDIPVLNDTDKEKMIEALVDVALDAMLDDAEELLAAPEVRLQALEEEIREVKRIMGVRRLWWYRVRNNPIPVAISVAAIGGLIFARRDNPFVAPTLQVVKALLSSAATALSVLCRILLNGLLTFIDVIYQAFVG